MAVPGHAASARQERVRGAWPPEHAVQPVARGARAFRPTRRA